LRRGDQESLAVAGHLRGTYDQLKVEQRLWNSGLEGGIGGYLYRHHLPIRGCIKQLLAVAAPARECPARLGDLISVESKSGNTISGHLVSFNETAFEIKPDGRNCLPLLTL
jgi:hypothetical protein